MPLALPAAERAAAGELLLAAGELLLAAGELLLAPVELLMAAGDLLRSEAPPLDIEKEDSGSGPQLSSAANEAMSAFCCRRETLRSLSEDDDGSGPRRGCRANEGERELMATTGAAQRLEWRERERPVDQIFSKAGLSPCWLLAPGDTAPSWTWFFATKTSRKIARR